MLSISTVEQETGITKDVLRKWETRFGYPQPARTPQGERCYSPDDLARLLVIKRLIDAGLKPAKVVSAPPADLETMASALCAPRLDQAAHNLQNEVRTALAAADITALKQCCKRQLMADGLRNFVLATLPQVNTMVGDEWASGKLSIHQEHLYSETLRYLLLEAISNLAPLAGHPKVLLTTAPEERHDLGLLMAHAIFALSGADCISLGTETPATEIIAAARRHGVQVVALSFSIAYPQRRITPFLEQVRARLPPEVRLWAGGAGVDRLHKQAGGVETFASLELAASALAA